MKINETLIESVRDYLIDVNMGFAKEALDYMGEDWLTCYSLDELYQDYCCGSLVELIDLFCNAGVGASDDEDYYVYDGDLRMYADIDEDVEYTLSDDDVIERILKYIDDGKLNPPSALEKIISENCVSWEDVSDALGTNYFVTLQRERATLLSSDYVPDSDDFKRLCEQIADGQRVLDCLRKTKFFGISEDAYTDLINAFNATPDWLLVVAFLAREHASGGIPFEKGVEMYLMNESVWFKKYGKE